MVDLSRRSREAEHMDHPGASGVALLRALDELGFINRYLGGHRSSIRVLDTLIHDSDHGTTAVSPLRILDVGAGGGDTSAALASWADRRGIPLRVVAVDFNREACAYAADRAAMSEHVSVVRADALKEPFPPESFDYVHCSLFLHHFETDAAVGLLTALFALSRRGLIINDLHRHPIAYWATKIGSSVMSRSYMVRHDGPVSVQRGFTRTDLVDLAEASGFRWTHLHWRWAFRYIAVACKSAPAQASRQNSP